MLLNRITNIYHFFIQKDHNKVRYANICNELQWLSINSICAPGKLNDRLINMVSEKPPLRYLRIIIIYKLLKLFSKVKNTIIVKEKLILIQTICLYSLSICLYRCSFLSCSTVFIYAFVCFIDFSFLYIYDIQF